MAESTSRDGSENSARSFAAAAQDEPAPGLLADFWDFLRHNKKWWLTPILLALLLVAALVFLSASPLAPFIYPLF
ncbi:MAG: DUF5989 family protein [Pirellulales bacterium]